MQFTTKHIPQIDLDINYANKLISDAYDAKFLGIYVESALSWKNHVVQITHIKCSLHPVRSVKLFMSQETLKMVDFACFYSIMNYGLILWGTSSRSAKIFKTQKNI